MKSRPGTPSSVTSCGHSGIGVVNTLMLLAFLSFPAAFLVAFAWFMLMALIGRGLPIPL